MRIHFLENLINVLLLCNSSWQNTSLANTDVEYHILFFHNKCAGTEPNCFWYHFGRLITFWREMILEQLFVLVVMYLHGSSVRGRGWNLMIFEGYACIVGGVSSFETLFVFVRSERLYVNSVARNFCDRSVLNTLS